MTHPEKVAAFCDAFKNEDVRKLSFYPPKGWERSVIHDGLTQLKLLPKIKKKIPSFEVAGCLVTQKSFEQATSEAVACYKASLMKGELLVDLSGGLGVDDIAFSNRFNHVISLDTDENLNAIFRYNIKKLGINNIVRINEDANAFLDKIPGKTTVYIDPDRRGEAGKRSILLRDCSPDIEKLVPKLIDKKCSVYIKLSPLFDKYEVLRSLSGVSGIYFISQDDEMKELLVKIQDATDITFVAMDTKNGNELYVEGKPEEHPLLNFASGSESYFYECGTALWVSGLWKKYANQFQLNLLHESVPYLVSNSLIPNFFGRKFQIKARYDGSLNHIAEALKQNGVKEAWISSKNIPVRNNALIQKLKLKERGNDFLFVTSIGKGNFVSFLCNKS